MIARPRLLDEFAAFLRGAGDYSEEQIRALLYERWDDPFPLSISDSVEEDIENFLYLMAEFAIVKGLEDVESGKLRVRIITYGSAHDRSELCVFEENTRTVLANFRGKTWHFDPDWLESTLQNLIEQLRESKELLALRSLTSA